MLPYWLNKKTHFNLNVYVNKQNLHIEATETPHTYEEAQAYRHTVELEPANEFRDEIADKVAWFFSTATKLLVKTLLHKERSLKVKFPLVYRHHVVSA